MARTKTKAETAPAARNQAEAEAFIARLGELQRAMLLENASLAETIAQAKEAAAAAVAKLQAEVDAVFRGVQIWAEANRHALTDGGKRKTVALAGGTIAWRQAPPAVSIKGTDKVLQYLLENGVDEFLRRKVEIDKAAMLGLPDRATQIPGVTIGSKGEEFVVEPAGAQEAGA